MTKAHLYNIEIASADVTMKADDFVAAQKKITAAVKHGIKHDLAAHGLSGEFAYAAARVPSIARSFQAYATPAALDVIKHVANVEDAKRMTFSAYALTRDI